MKEILNRLFRHEELSTQETKNIMLQITRQAYSDVEIASLLTAFQMRSITPDELLGFREALMETCISLDFSAYKPIDIVGTGGDGKNTFNISTCACFVLAGAGYKVVKHGNYGSTSISGASNVIESHGIKFSNDYASLERSLEQCNMAYLHAPLFNPAMKSVAPVRKALGVRTLFNLLGPLVNPCKPTYQLLGVADLSQMRLYTNVFYKMGVNFSVVSSLDAYDEISLTTDFKVITREYEQIFSPHQLGLNQIRQSEIFGGKSITEAMTIFDNVLQGTSTQAQKQCVLANAAFAIQILEPNKTIEECLAIAQESIDSKRAWNALIRFVELNS